MDISRENTKLKDFLLGNSAEADAEEIGVRIITDCAFDEKMSCAEAELIEDFLENELSAEEKELFYANFLITPERIALLEEIAAVKIYAKKHFADGAEKASDEKKSASLFENLRAFLSLNLRPVAAVLIVLVVGAIVWRVVFYHGGESLSPTEKEYAALNAKDLNNPSETANFTNKSLSAGTFRDGNTAAKLSAETLTENVFFRLALPAETPKDTLFNLELNRGGQIVFRQTNLRVYQNQNGQEIKVILPKSVLSKGIYQIKLGNGGTYGFAVE